MVTAGLSSVVVAASVIAVVWALTSEVVATSDQPTPVNGEPIVADTTSCPDSALSTRPAPSPLEWASKVKTCPAIDGVAAAPFIVALTNETPAGRVIAICDD